MYGVAEHCFLLLPFPRVYYVFTFVKARLLEMYNAINILGRDVRTHKGIVANSFVVFLFSSLFFFASLCISLFFSLYIFFYGMCISSSEAVAVPTLYENLRFLKESEHFN